MEAAASGLPVVATNIRGCRQVVDPGVTGALVPVRDAKALADALQTCAAEPTRHTLGMAGRAKAITDFDEATVVARVLAAYNSSSD